MISNLKKFDETETDKNSSKCVVTETETESLATHWLSPSLLGYSTKPVPASGIVCATSLSLEPYRNIVFNNSKV